MRVLGLLVILGFALFAVPAFEARSASLDPPVVARVGINLPTMGIVYFAAGRNWRWSIANYFSSAVMSEIKNDLHADYVRTGFIPDWVHKEHPEWQREDRVMDDACKAGLGVMVIVPSGNDKLGLDDLAATSDAFFTRYTAREKSCKLVAEIGNEDNLIKSPQGYAAIFERLAPGIRVRGIPIVTAGTSLLDARWAKAVSQLVAPAAPDGFGFHPYDVPPDRLQADIATMAAVTATGPDRIYITEYGSGDAVTLSKAILTLGSQPAVTVYEYRCQANGEPCKYGLKDHPDLYEAVRNAFAVIQAHRSL